MHERMHMRAHQHRVGQGHQAKLSEPPLIAPGARQPQKHEAVKPEGSLEVLYSAIFKVHALKPQSSVE